MTKKRISRLRGLLKQQNLDALLVSTPVNRRYLSGFLPDDGQWGETSGSLFISQWHAVLLTDFRYELSAREQAPFFMVRIYRKGLARELASLVRDSSVKRLGVEAEGMLVFQKEALEKALNGLDLVSTLGLVSRLRRLKDPRELEAMRQSLALAEQALEKVISPGIVGKTEWETALAVTRAMEDLGAEGPAFDPIVASGPNGAEPHAEPGRRVIQSGEPVIFDVGAKLNGYCSDISRTVVAGGWERADDKLKEVYSVVRRAQLKAIELTKPGMTGQQADEIAREVIDQAGYGERFGHSLGHGVGLATHEAPSVGPGSKAVLEPGMVFTVEPGIYLPGWGGVRLEQMVEMGRDGCRLMNRLNMFADF